MPRTCPNCGRYAENDAAHFCSYCGTRLGVTSNASASLKKTGLPIAAGILTILAGCAAFILGMVGILAFAFDSYNIYFFYYGNSVYGYLIMGGFSILAFAFGLTGGIFAIKRKHFTKSVALTSLVLVSGLATMLTLALERSGSVIGGLLNGLPVTILSILGLIFVWVSKGEFA